LYDNYYRAIRLNIEGGFKAPRAVLTGRLRREEWEANLFEPNAEEIVGESVAQLCD
jgi:hypothetical protein